MYYIAAKTAMKKIEIKSHTKEEIEDLLKSKEDYKTACRLLCMLQLAKGESSRKAQELLLISHNQVCIWAKRFNEKGVEGLKDRVKTGRKPGLSNEQLALLKNLVVNQNPEDHGYNSGTWTAPLISDWLTKQCNVKYSDDNIYLLLKNKLNLKHKKGKGFYPEADDEQRQIFADTLKKTSRDKAR
jgi:transposase